VLYRAVVLAALILVCAASLEAAILLSNPDDSLLIQAVSSSAGCGERFAADFFAPTFSLLSGSLRTPVQLPAFGLLTG
jgi:hypothetical protein